MITRRLGTCLIAALVWTVPAGAGAGQALNKNLELLEPLVNKTWMGHMKALDSDRMIEVPRRWDVIWGGQAVKFSSYVEELDNFSEGYLYWDPEETAIAIFRINNKGTITYGHVREEDGKILMHGRISFTDRTLEFRNTFELTGDGRLIDRWFRLEDGEWKAGHVVELEVSGSQ